MCSHFKVKGVRTHADGHVRKDGERSDHLVVDVVKIIRETQLGTSRTAHEMYIL